MDEVASSARLEQMERSVLALAAATDQVEAEVASAANIQWESPAADAFRHGLVQAVQDLPSASGHLRSAGAELRQDSLTCAAAG